MYQQNIGMKYCTSENQEVTFKQILKSDFKKLWRQKKLYGGKMFLIFGKYKPEIRFCGSC